MFLLLFFFFNSLSTHLWGIQFKDTAFFGEMKIYAANNTQDTCIQCHNGRLHSVDSLINACVKCVIQILEYYAWFSTWIAQLDSRIMFLVSLFQPSSQNNLTMSAKLMHTLSSSYSPSFPVFVFDGRILNR